MGHWGLKLFVRSTSLVLLLLLSGCSSTPENLYYSVQPGDTLYSIAWRFDQEYREIAGWNAIPRPYRISPGQQLRVLPYSQPDEHLMAADEPAVEIIERAPASKAEPKRVKKSVSKVRAKTRAPSATLKPKARPASNRSLKWRWPTSGKILSSFSSRKTGRQGINIGGKSGQKVLAAADGQVVYSGTGLKGYGRLIIIKHNDSYLSAYAHNRKLLVREKSTVRVGQAIAEMGSSGARQTMLHFELRKNGKPVNPLRYLPKRR